MLSNEIDIFILEPDALFRKIIQRIIKDIETEKKINIFNNPFSFFIFIYKKQH